MRHRTPIFLLVLGLLLAGCGRDLPEGVEGHAVLLVAGGDGRGWSQLLRGSFGAHDVVPARDFLGDPAGPASGRALVLLDREATAAADPALLLALAPAMEAGLAVLLVQPGEELAPTLGLALASRDEATHLPWPASPGPGWSPPRPGSPVAVAHTVSRLHPAGGRGPRAELLAAPAGRAVLWRRAHGAGGAWALALPLGEIAATGPEAARCAARWWEVLLAPSSWPFVTPHLGPPGVARHTALHLGIDPGGQLELRLDGPAGESAELWLPVQRGVTAMAGWEGDAVETLGRREGLHGPERGFRLPADGGELRVGYIRF